MLVGRCVSYGEGATFLPLVEMIGADVLGAGSTGEIFLAARRRFEELAAERPLLLVFEDVHWAEPTLLDFVEYLGAQATGSPILALCLSRPDLLAERSGWKASLTLEPLTTSTRASRRRRAARRPHRRDRGGQPALRPAARGLRRRGGRGRARRGSRLDRSADREPPRPAGGGRAGARAAGGGRRTPVLAGRRRGPRAAGRPGGPRAGRLRPSGPRHVPLPPRPRPRRRLRGHTEVGTRGAAPAARRLARRAAGRLGRAGRLPPRAGGRLPRRARRARAAGDAAGDERRPRVSAPPGSGPGSAATRGQR